MYFTPFIPPPAAEFGLPAPRVPESTKGRNLPFLLLMPPLRVVLSGCFLVIGGCSLVPDYSRPDLSLPTDWSAAGSVERRDGVKAADKWWDSFGSAELSALIDRSHAGNFTLQAAAARIEEARGTAASAASGLYPSVGVGVTVDKTDTTKHSRTRSIFAQASYEVDFWGKADATADSAEALARATQFDAETVRLSLDGSVANAYFQILSLRERLALAGRIAKSARDLLALIEARAAQGAASDLDVQQQRNAVAGFDGALPTLRQQRDQAMHLMAALLGHPRESLEITGEDLATIGAPPVAPDLPVELLERRPDIQAAEARLISANFDIGAVRAAYFPSLSLSVEGGMTNNAVTRFFPPLVLSSFAANLVQPVFEGGRLDGQLAVDRARATELAALYRQAVVAALQDVEDALTAGANLDEFEKHASEAVDAARRASVMATAQYRLGAADFLTVLTAERTLYQSEDSLLQVRVQRLQAAVQLFRALGGGFTASSIVSMNGPTTSPR